MSRCMLYLIIFPKGNEEKIYIESLDDLFRYIREFSLRYGQPPDLIYRKE